MSQRPAGQPIRVLVVEDSRAQRELLVGLLGTTREFVVAGTASNGQEAIAAALQLRPDVIAMDIHLPILDGYDATRQIMQRCPTPIVMVSSAGDDASRRSVEALAAGALAVVRKPSSAALAGNHADRAAFLTTLRLMAGVRVVTRHGPRVVPPNPAAETTGLAPLVLVIAASTGGPAALQRVLQGLGGHFPLPILVVQHIARGFVTALADWLNATVPMPVVIASNEQRLQPSQIYLAPDDHHIITRERGTVAPRPAAATDRFCPSADLLFESVAHSYRARAIGLILTGMGDDGTAGLRALHAAGARTLAQDEASSVVYGMPRAAAAAGVIGRVAPLSELADLILQSIAEERCREAG